jgi:nucleoside-diphosphate-sugar epimerase
MKKKKIGITGAGGFVGKHLTKKLSEVGYQWEASAVDLDKEAPNFNSCDHVLHLAARTFVPDSWETPVSFYQTNTLGTARVLDSIHQAGASMTFISSYVYGIPQYLPIDEQHSTTPANPYMQSKILGEQLCQFYANNFNIPICILRPFNLYGAGLGDKFLIQLICKQVLDPNISEVSLRSLAPKRDYVYIDDLVTAIIASIDMTESATINIASGKSYSVEELVHIVMDIAGIHKPIVSTAQPRPNEIMDTKAAIDLAKKHLNWSPKVDMNTGIKEILKQMQ